MSASFGPFAPATSPPDRQGPQVDGPDPAMPAAFVRAETRLPGRSPDGSRPSLQRRHLVAVASGLAVLLVLSVFARSLSEASVGSERATALRAENALLQERLDAGRREVALVQGDAFVRLEARAYGYGQSGERVFAMASDAPPPPPITPLGAPPRSTGSDPRLRHGARLPPE